MIVICMFILFGFCNIVVLELQLHLKSVLDMNYTRSTYVFLVRCVLLRLCSFVFFLTIENKARAGPSRVLERGGGGVGLGKVG